jgi:NagD protein
MDQTRKDRGALEPEPADLKRLTRIRHVVLDLDGTIYKGSEIFNFSHGFFKQLERLGIGYTYLTNNSSLSVDQYLQKIKSLGLEVAAENIYTSSLATIDYLKTRQSGLRKLYILGTDGLKKEFREYGFLVVGQDDDEEPDAVIVGFDTSLDYKRLCKAGYWIKLGKPFIATHPDRICPTNQPTLLIDCGAICAALSSATGKAPEVVLGKPDPGMLWGIMERNKLLKDEVAVVGDRLSTDIEMARRAGVMGILVLTGDANVQDVKSTLHPPDLIVDNIQMLGNLLERSHLFL